MSNKEGYPDKTADTAISRVAREQKMAGKRKGGRKDHGKQSSTAKAEKGNKN